MNEFVIYSAIVGHYDEINQPKVVDDRFDYILFSDTVEKKQIGVWQVRSIPYHNEIQTKIARWVKTHPELLLSEYKASLWLDSNVIISDSFVYDRVVELAENHVLVSTTKHSERSCVYGELFEILCRRIESEKVVLRWGHRLRKEKYPKDHGLSETGVLFRFHSENKIALFDQMWWNCIEKYSRRDQASFNFVLWKMDIPWQYFIPDGGSVYYSNCFVCVEHKENGCISRRITRKKMEAWLIRYYEKCPEKRQAIEEVYYRLYGSPFPVIGALLLGQYYRIQYILFRK